MFNKYFRTYPLFLQFMLFALMVSVFVSMFIVVGGTIPKLTGIAPASISNLNDHSSARVITTAILLQFLSSIMVFALPALVFAYLAHPNPATYLGMHKPSNPKQWLLVPLVMIGAIPIMLEIGNLMSHFNFGSSANALQKKDDTFMKALLTMHSPLDLIKTFIILAVTPAICEELFFRSIALRFLKKVFPTMLAPIIISSVVFAFMHSSVYNFLPIFLAGCLLATIYYLTGSVYCSMLAHFLNNGIQILLLYLTLSNPGVKDAVDNNTLPMYLPIIGLAVFGISFYLLLKNKTPLPPKWESDFTEAELSENAS